MELILTFLVIALLAWIGITSTTHLLAITTISLKMSDMDTIFLIARVFLLLICGIAGAWVLFTLVHVIDIVWWNYKMKKFKQNKYEQEKKDE